MSEVIVVGGGPAGSISALALRKLGHRVRLYEKAPSKRYRIGESLLPGTMSILNRLGLEEKIDAAGYVRKPSATFLWGQDQAPWTFSFTTARSAPWIFDHAIQVKREEFDSMLLDEARSRGAEVNMGVPVVGVEVDHADRVAIVAETAAGTERVEGDYLIDASGSGSVLVRKLKLRRYDEFYKSFAVWSYFRLPDPFKGDLNGTTYSITFQDGWVWMIPLKGNLYSVGLIVDQAKIKEVATRGREQFYRETLARCARAMKILDGAEMVDEVRVVQDWSYDTTTYSAGRFFLAGDAACFTDPLFSQGVHLAAQSAVSAAAAIDRLSRQPAEHKAVHSWYGQSYGDTYEQYHEFLASFYTFASFTEPESDFWKRRRISESQDARLERKAWFDRLVHRTKMSDEWDIADFRDRASTMIAIGRHQRLELSDEFRDSELTPARVKWIGQLTKQLNSIKRLAWVGDEVRLRPYYKVHPQTFQLEEKLVISNERGQAMTKYPLGETERSIFARLKSETFGYREVIDALNDAGRGDSASQIVVRMLESGLLYGFDAKGSPVRIQDRLRFDGVGEEYEI